MKESLCLELQISKHKHCITSKCPNIDMVPL